MHIDFLKEKKQTHRKGNPSDLPRVTKVSERKVSDCKQLKILTPKQRLQGLPIVLTQVKAGNTSEILLNEIR